MSDKPREWTIFSESDECGVDGPSTSGDKVRVIEYSTYEHEQKRAIAFKEQLEQVRIQRELLKSTLEHGQVFGELRISTNFNRDEYWIEHESGEGMGVSRLKFDTMLAAWYKENF